MGVSAIHSHSAHNKRRSRNSPADRSCLLAWSRGIASTPFAQGPNVRVHEVSALPRTESSSARSGAGTSALHLDRAGNPAPLRVTAGESPSPAACITNTVEVKIIHMSNAPTQNEARDSLAEFFGEPISVYTDAQAREDGFLAVPDPAASTGLLARCSITSPFVREKRRYRKTRYRARDPARDGR